MLTRLVLTVGLAIALSGAFAPTALAECMDWPIRADERLAVAYAFTATVVEASKDVDPAQPDSSEFDWHVELLVDKIYRGKVPERIAFNGWSVGCHQLQGQHLRTGERLFIVTNVYTPNPSQVDPFSSIDSQLIVWRQIDGEWRFHQDALDQGFDSQFYPADARRATSTEDILRLGSRAVVPPTSTAPENVASSRAWHAPVLAVTFLVGVALITRRLDRATRPDG